MCPGPQPRLRGHTTRRPASDLSSCSSIRPMAWLPCLATSAGLATLLLGGSLHDFYGQWSWWQQGDDSGSGVHRTRTGPGVCGAPSGTVTPSESPAGLWTVTGGPTGHVSPKSGAAGTVRCEAKAVLLTKLHSLLTSLCLGSPHTWSPGTQPPGPASPQLPEDQLSLLVS